MTWRSFVTSPQGSIPEYLCGQYGGCQHSGRGWATYLEATSGPSMYMPCSKETSLSVTTIRFPVRVGFHARVKQRVHQYFADNRKPKTGDWRLFLKTGIILIWFVLFYILYVFFATSLLMALLTVVALAQGFIL